MTEINSRIAVRNEAGTVLCIHGHMPVFLHEEADVGSCRMFTSQMFASGTVKPNEIARRSGVPTIAVKRYVKLYRDHGAGSECQVSVPAAEFQSADEAPVRFQGAAHIAGIWISAAARPEFSGVSARVASLPS